MKKLAVFNLPFQKMPIFVFKIHLIQFNMERNINRIKVVLVDKLKTNKWLAEQLNVAPTTVSKWCTNAAQPPLETLMQIAKLLDVQVDDLLRFEELPEIAEVK
jgi:DNA-binding Xre family transcriptional regulator